VKLSSRVVSHRLATPVRVYSPIVSVTFRALMRVPSISPSSKVISATLVEGRPRLVGPESAGRRLSADTLGLLRRRYVWFHRRPLREGHRLANSDTGTDEDNGQAPAAPFYSPRHSR